MGSVELLDRRVMTAHEAARQLDIPVTTLIRWLEGEQRRDNWYPPVLREEPTGQLDVTWGEVGGGSLSAGLPREERADAEIAALHRRYAAEVRGTLPPRTFQAVRQWPPTAA